MIIILFKKKQKTKTCSVNGPVLRAHRRSDVETLWLSLFVLSKCCWTTLVLGVRCHEFKWIYVKKNTKSIQRTAWGLFTFNSVLFFASKCENWTPFFFNKRPSIHLSRTLFRTNALPTTNQLQFQFIFTTDWIESRNWPLSIKTGVNGRIVDI